MKKQVKLLIMLQNWLDFINNKDKKGDKYSNLSPFMLYYMHEWRRKMISIKNVSKSYDKKNRIINNLNLEINDGEIFGFLGPNGAGKSTTIKMITGILDIDEGDILINGKSIINDPIEAKKLFRVCS